MLYDFKKHVIFHDFSCFLAKKCWRQQKKALESRHGMSCESLYDKDFSCY